jgi:hypothetical protein
MDKKIPFEYTTEFQGIMVFTIAESEDHAKSIIKHLNDLQDKSSKNNQAYLDLGRMKDVQHDLIRVFENDISTRFQRFQSDSLAAIMEFRNTELFCPKCFTGFTEDELHELLEHYKYCEGGN